MGKSPNIPDPGAVASQGIRTDSTLQPFNYLIDAASRLGVPITLPGPNGTQTYDFSGKGAADVAGTVSDQMAATLLKLQQEKDPAIIAAQLKELQAADPQGYAARKQLFDRIMADASANPGRPVATDLQQSLQDELAKGVGFDDAKQEQQVRDQVRGGQVASGIYRGNAAASQEGQAVVNAGESLQSQRQQNALNLLNSGAAPEDVAYRQFQQSIANLGAFENGTTPEAQFQQVSAAGQGPVSMTGLGPNSNTFNPNAAGQGLNNALGIYNGQIQWNNGQANPWLAGLGTGASAFGSLSRINPGWFGGTVAGTPGLTYGQVALGNTPPNWNP